jgi:hypothetical protein
MLFMVIEHFKQGEAPAVYRRLREKGRMAPEGVQHLGSWVDFGFKRCFQVMERKVTPSCGNGPPVGTI